MGIRGTLFNEIINRTLMEMKYFHDILLFKLLKTTKFGKIEWFYGL